MVSSLTTKLIITSMDKHDIPLLGNFYTKAEVDQMIADALAEARRIDEESMRKHNRDATITVSYTHLTLPTIYSV